MSRLGTESMKAAKEGVEAVREGTKHGFASVVSALVKGVNVASDVAAVLRGLDGDEALAWVGLARRHPFRSFLFFGAGVAVGAGLGVLFAPMSGAEMRRAMMDRFGEKSEEEAAAPPTSPAPAVEEPKPAPAKPAAATMPS